LGNQCWIEPTYKTYYLTSYLSPVIMLPKRRGAWSDG
jgi:hypothetical protein